MNFTSCAHFSVLLNAETYTTRSLPCCCCRVSRERERTSALVGRLEASCRLRRLRPIWNPNGKQRFIGSRRSRVGSKQAGGGNRGRELGRADKRIRASVQQTAAACNSADPRSQESESGVDPGRQEAWHRWTAAPAASLPMTWTPLPISDAQTLNEIKPFRKHYRWRNSTRHCENMHPPKNSSIDEQL